LDLSLFSNGLSRKNIKFVGNRSIGIVELIGKTVGNRLFQLDYKFLLAFEGH
jgi:hypothetical protein